MGIRKVRDSSYSRLCKTAFQSVEMELAAGQGATFSGALDGAADGPRGSGSLGFDSGSLPAWREGAEDGE